MVDQTQQAIVLLKQCVEALERRYRTTGTNTWDDEARLAGRAFIKEHTNEVYDFYGNRWVVPGTC